MKGISIPYTIFKKLLRDRSASPSNSCLANATKMAAALAFQLIDFLGLNSISEKESYSIISSLNFVLRLSALIYSQL